MIKNNTKSLSGKTPLANAQPELPSVFYDMELDQIECWRKAA
jgi:hypothetical protein